MRESIPGAKLVFGADGSRSSPLDHMLGKAARYEGLSAVYELNLLPAHEYQIEAVALQVTRLSAPRKCCSAINTAPMMFEPSVGQSRVN